MRMKSCKKRRAELEAKKKARLAKAASDAALLAREREAARGVPVSFDALELQGSYYMPDFAARGYYLDYHFTCRDCKVADVWTAERQKWWFEVAKKHLNSCPRRCLPCEHREHERKAEARRVHLEGIVRKQQKASTPR